MSRLRYKTGARVVLVKHSPRDSTPIINDLMATDKSLTGVVLDARDVGWVVIQFDRFVDGHSAEGRGRQGYCWGVAAEYVKPHGMENYGLEKDA